ncbi:MAG TPA: hypothetical protein VJ044_18415 [Candidatus Hodarchaeales archaeon]|nr:hypothetical protein [Candidatus Hodarchaeales archaeon]
MAGDMMDEAEMPMDSAKADCDVLKKAAEIKKDKTRYDAAMKVMGSEGGSWMDKEY